MNYAAELVCGESTIENPSLEDVQRAVDFLRTAAKSELLIAGSGSDVFLLVYYFDPHGYYVSGSCEGDNDYFTLVRGSGKEESVTVFLGGDTATIPLDCLVDREAAMSALKHFLTSGLRNKGLHWVKERELLR